MAAKPEIRYINYYTSGTAARKVEVQPVRQKKPRLPKPRIRQDREILLHIDPVAIMSVVVASVLLVLMVVGVSRMNSLQEQTQVTAQYVQQLKEENLQLKETYTAGYDLEEIKQLATAMGMVPMEELPREMIYVKVPAPQAEATGWDNFVSFLTGLFA